MLRSRSHEKFTLQQQRIALSVLLLPHPSCAAEWGIAGATFGDLDCARLNHNETVTKRMSSNNKKNVRGSKGRATARREAFAAARAVADVACATTQKPVTCV
jgi:hypothetical protein